MLPLKLFLNFFVRCACAIPFAKFRKIKFSLYLFLIFASPVVDSFARCALKFDKIWLWHSDVLVCGRFITQI